MAADIICHVTKEGFPDTFIVRPSELEFLLTTLQPGETMKVISRERHPFIKDTGKYPGGAPSIRSFFDVCGMEDCGLSSTDPVHY